MKVEGPKNTQGTSKTKKKSSVSSGDTSFRSMISSGTEQASSAGSAHSVASIDSLLSVQAAEDPTEKAAQKRMRYRADTILHELEKIRMGLLTGSLTVGALIDIASVITSHRERVMDPQLTALLDEIDLRAQIELAKLRVSMDSVS